MKTDDEKAAEMVEAFKPLADAATAVLDKMPRRTKAYPLVGFVSSWTYLGEDGERHTTGSFCTDLLLGGPMLGFDEGDIRDLALKNFEAALANPSTAKRPGYADAKDFRVVEIIDKGEATWAITWFQHYCIDDGQDDAEVVASLEEYLYAQLELADGRDVGRLMGLEDRWRWKPPCRCEHCKRAGVIRVDH
jgi:hypothetical protein